MERQKLAKVSFSFLFFVFVLSPEDFPLVFHYANLADLLPEKGNKKEERKREERKKDERNGGKSNRWRETVVQDTVLNCSSIFS